MTAASLASSVADGEFAARTGEPAHTGLVAASLALIVLILVTVCGRVDAQIFGLMAPSITKDFGLTDTRMGLLQGVAFNLGAVICLVPVGRLIDHAARLRILMFFVAVWSLFSTLTGLCTSYAALFACRMGIGAAEIGLSPVCYSLIADYFSPRYRGKAYLAFQGGVLICVSLAISFVGTFIAALRQHAEVLPFGLNAMPLWRSLFIFSGVPAVILIALLLLAREPSRIHSANVEARSDASLPRYLLGEGRTTLMTIGSTTFAIVGFQAMLFWMPTVLNRMHGFTPDKASKAMSLAIGLGTGAGVVVAWALTMWLDRRSAPLAPLRILRVGIIGSCLVQPAMLLTNSSDQMKYMWVAFNVFTYMAHAVAPAMLAFTTPSTLRGRVFAVWNFAALVVGAISPTLIGFLSDHLFAGPGGALLACVIVSTAANLIALLMTVGQAKPIEAAAAKVA